MEETMTEEKGAFQNINNQWFNDGMCLFFLGIFKNAL